MQGMRACFGDARFADSRLRCCQLSRTCCLRHRHPLQAAPSTCRWPRTTRWYRCCVRRWVWVPAATSRHACFRVGARWRAAGLRLWARAQSAPARCGCAPPASSEASCPRTAPAQKEWAAGREVACALLDLFLTAEETGGGGGEAADLGQPGFKHLLSLHAFAATDVEL